MADWAPWWIAAGTAALVAGTLSLGTRRWRVVGVVTGVLVPIGYELMVQWLTGRHDEFIALGSLLAACITVPVALGAAYCGYRIRLHGGAKQNSAREAADPSGQRAEGE